jgi:hypothetical protein
LLRSGAPGDKGRSAGGAALRMKAFAIADFQFPI